jgi:uncharacterized protein YndB with AHSA1/START domain
MVDNSKWVKIERLIDAPIEKVWDLWTDPALFQQWYGPKGMSIPVAEMDIVVGGVRKICMAMKTPDREMSMWFTGVYKEVSKPTRFVYTVCMCDDNGTIITKASMGMPEGSPDITEVIVELAEVDGKTHMKMVHVGVVAGTAGDGGWNQAIDKLVEYIATSA